LTLVFGCGGPSGQKRDDAGGLPGDASPPDVGVADADGVDAAISSEDASAEDSGVSLGDAAPEAGDASPPSMPLCDGVAHPRLWVLSQSGRETLGATVRTELGYPFLLLDGICTYWTGGGWSEDMLGRDRPVRTGVLTEVEVETLERALPIADVAALDDCQPEPGSFDVPVRGIRVGGGVAWCESKGPVFDAAWKIVRALAAQLWTEGTPVTGPLHVAVRGASTTSNPAPYPWPLVEPLRSFAPPDGRYDPGTSYTVSDPAATAKLRALRDQYLADRAASSGLYSNWDGLKAADTADAGFVFMRDAIPYEDARGLLQF